MTGSEGDNAASTDDKINGKAILAALIVISRYLASKDDGAFSAYLGDSLVHAADSGIPAEKLSVLATLVRAVRS